MARDERLCEMPEWIRTQWIVLALSVNFAYVKLFQLAPKFLQNSCSFAHCWVNLTSMTDVETEGGLRQAIENVCKIPNRLTEWLSLVHVLDAKKLSKSCPFLRSVHRVRVNDNRPSPRCDFSQKFYRLTFK